MADIQQQLMSSMNNQNDPSNTMINFSINSQNGEFKKPKSSRRGGGSKSTSVHKSQKQQASSSNMVTIDYDMKDDQKNSTKKNDTTVNLNFLNDNTFNFNNFGGVAS